MKLILALILTITAAWATVSQGTVWEVRPGVGADTNGGGFVTGATGTDFSQQNAAQYNAADLASANGTTNPCTVSSASHNFVAADVGNIINISAGTNWTTGYYQIVSVAANAAHLDRACGSVAALSNGTYAVGGALATVSAAYGGATTQNHIYIKATGNYTVTATLTLTLSDGTIPFIFEGYTTTRGDRGQATWTTATNSVHLVTTGATTGYVFKNIIFSSTAGTPGNGIQTGTAGNANSYLFDNDRFTGLNIGINGPFSTQYYITGLSIIDCQFDNNKSHGIINQTWMIHGSWFHDNGGDGAFCSNQAGIGPIGCSASLSVFSKNTSAGIEIGNLGTSNSRNPHIVNCVLYKNTGDGIKASGTTQEGIIANSVLYGNGGFGVNFATNTGSVNGAAAVANYSNAYGSNTSGARTGNFPTGVGDVTLTGDPFISATNFQTNNTAGAGAALRAAGFPGVSPMGTGYVDIGALQHQDSGSSAATTGHTFSMLMGLGFAGLAIAFLLRK